MKPLQEACQERLRLMGATGACLLPEDVMGLRSVPRNTSSGIHVVLQVPLFSSFPSEAYQSRQREFLDTLKKSLQNEFVAAAHVLTESVLDQVVLYALLPSELHRKVYTWNLNRRLLYADAVRYSHEFLQGRVVLLLTADVAVAGSEWGRISPEMMQNRLFGLTRHELPSCGVACDCLKMFDGCHDGFMFRSPLAGGDELLERISFRFGGLWGSENRFMWEVSDMNRQMKISNPCKTFRLEHHHCGNKGMFRPAQDPRRINVKGKSLAPDPSAFDS